MAVKKDQGTVGPSGLGGRVSRALKKAVRRSSGSATTAADPAQEAPVKKSSAAKTAASKAAAKRAPAASSAQKPAAKKAPAKKAATKAPANKTTAKKAPAKKAATKAPAAKASAKKTVAKKAATRPTATKKAATKAAAKSAKGAKPAASTTSTSEVDVSTKGPASEDAAKKSSAKPVKKAAKATPARLKVRGDESPWTTKELDEVRAQLTEDIERLTAELSDIEHEIIGLMQDSGDGAGDDQADAGTKTFEREHEFTVAQNSREMLLQSQRALTAIDDGTYGVCENCGNAIGKLRLQAFPRATLCLPCKQLQERH